MYKVAFGVYSGEYNAIDELLQSIKNLKFNHKEILVYLDSRIEVNNTYGLNTEIIETDKKAAFYNQIIQRKEAEYFAFIDSSCFYRREEVLKEVFESKAKLVALNSAFYNRDKEKFERFNMFPKLLEIDLNEFPNQLALNQCAYFYHRDVIEDIVLDETLPVIAYEQLLWEALKRCPKYTYIKYGSLGSYTPYTLDKNKSPLHTRKKWYINYLDYFFNDIKAGANQPYLIEFFMYMLYTKYKINMGINGKGVLNNEEIEAFFEKTFEYLTVIPFENLIQVNEIREDLKTVHPATHRFKMEKWFKYLLLREYLKRNNIEHSFETDNQHMYLVVGNQKYIYNHLYKEAVNITAINYENNSLTFECGTSVSCLFRNEDIKIVAEYGEKTIEIERNEIYSLLKLFGTTVDKGYPFSFKVDLDLSKKRDLYVYYVINGRKIPLLMKYKKYAAHLTNKSGYSFWRYKDFMLKNEVDHIEIYKASPLDTMKKEILFDLALFKYSSKKPNAIFFILFRYFIYLTRPFFKNKHIWITFDKLYKGGDNGEYLWHYGRKNNKNIYYIVKTDAYEYPRMRKIDKKHVLAYRTIRELFYVLHSEAILSTHVNIPSYTGMGGFRFPYLVGLFNAKNICVQHGLTIQKIAQFQNKKFDNITYYCCASKYEVSNITQPIYGYKENQISLTGLARYDGLKSNDQKIILITPTWRRNIVSLTVANTKRKHNDSFIKSDYYKIYNSLINNQQLVENAKKNGYRIIYLLHPAMSGQLEDFKGDPYIEVIAATSDMNYEKILTESSVMVTDYSGVQFDFAYQRKVLLYYHPTILPPQYEEGGLKYDTMGFGPVIGEEEELVNQLCDYMDHGCKIKDEYRRRADDFFAFSDHNSCERIIKAVEGYLSTVE